MEHPTILYEIAKLRHEEIIEEMAEWRMAKRAKPTKPGVIKPFVMVCETLFKKLSAQDKAGRLSSDERLVLNTNK